MVQTIVSLLPKRYFLVHICDILPLRIRYVFDRLDRISNAIKKPVVRLLLQSTYFKTGSKLLSVPLNNYYGKSY